MSKASLLIATILLSLTALAQSQPSHEQDWSDWNLVMGNWLTGSGGGTTGTTGTGWLTFQPELGGKILVRKNHAEYPPHKGQPGVIHDDLTIIYREGGALKAFYDDSDGHVVRYDVSFSPDKKKIIFVSEKSAPGPHYRVTYEGIGQGTIKLSFDVAPADQPDKFELYIEGLAHRKNETVAQQGMAAPALHDVSH